MSATWPLAAWGPAAPIGTWCGGERAAGSAKAIATIAITAANAMMMPVARTAAGGSCEGGGVWGCFGSDCVVMALAFSSDVELPCLAERNSSCDEFQQLLK